MKSLIQLLLTFLIANCSCSQKKIKGFTYIEHEKESFYIKNTEVTVKEYFEFVDWVIDSIARRTLAQNGFAKEFLTPEIHDTDFNINGDYVYKLDYYEKLDWDNIEYYEILIPELIIPEDERFYRKRQFNPKKIIYRGINYNTLVLPREFEYPNTIVYIPNKKGNNFIESIHPAKLLKPIYNISHEQAEAYCEWKTNQLNKKSTKNKKVCSLPSISNYETILDYKLSWANWLQVHPDELERKIISQNAKTIQTLNDSIIILNDSILSLRQNKEYFESGVLSQVYYKLGDTINPSNEKFNRVLKHTKDYYIYTEYKKLQGLKDNVSEWTKTSLEMNDSTLKKQAYEFNGKNIYLGDIGQYCYAVVGGNWWHGYDGNAKTYLKYNKQLETIGFRYVIYQSKK